MFYDLVLELIYLMRLLDRRGERGERWGEKRGGRRGGRMLRRGVWGWERVEFLLRILELLLFYIRIFVK